MATAATGLFLIFTVFTAPLFSMVSFTPAGGGGGYMQQASAQSQSTPTPPTLPFTPFSLQQQEAVPEEQGEGEQQQPTTEDGAQALREPGNIEVPNLSEETAPMPPADDQTTLRPGQDVPLTPTPTEPTTRKGGDQSGGSNTTTPSGSTQIKSE